MFDLVSLKSQVDLLALAGRYTSLRRVATTGGGEWAGPCPFCGGVDRFHVQPHTPGGGRWLCRRCSQGRWRDAIDFGQRLWPGLDFKVVLERLSGGSIPLEHRGRKPGAHSSRQVLPAYAPPGEAWQALALRAVEICERNLWAPVGAGALAYLRGRGLQDETLRHWRLGYSPGLRLSAPAGESPAPEAEMWTPRGVLAPCLVGGRAWYLKVSLLPGEQVKCERCGEQARARYACPACGALTKYRGVKGNRPAAIFGADGLVGSWAALFVEGEFDAMIAWQELHDVIAVCTLGSATNRPDLATWGAYLLGLEWVLAAYDDDEAGRRGAAVLEQMSERVRAIPLPPGAKDINDFTLAGGELWPWLKGELLKLGIVEQG